MTRVNFSLPAISPDFYFAAMPTMILCLGSLVALMQSVFPKVLKKSFDPE